MTDQADVGSVLISGEWHPSSTMSQSLESTALVGTSLTRPLGADPGSTPTPRTVAAGGGSTRPPQGRTPSVARQSQQPSDAATFRRLQHELEPSITEAFTLAAAGGGEAPPTPDRVPALPRTPTNTGPQPTRVAPWWQPGAGSAPGTVAGGAQDPLARMARRGRGPRVDVKPLMVVQFLVALGLLLFGVFGSR